MFLALFPPLALRWPIHKWAAVAALAAAVAYLLISGAAVATQRSFLMISLVFLGIFVGRRGLTLRSVALAGLFLLLVAPERLFFPGFQMSFAAVICLVAVYEIWRGRDRSWHFNDRRAAGRGRRFLQFLAKWIAGLFVTALVAGLATGIIGAHHFGRIAPYGVLGNLLGMPIFSLLVMPMGVLALVLMPLGLSAFPLTLMALGLSLLLKIAAFTAALSDGAGAVGALSGISAVLLVSALFASLLLPGWRRLYALAPLGAALISIVVMRPPDIQIAATGSRVAARDGSGLLRLSSGRQSFVGEIWMQREGVPAGAIGSRTMKSPQRRCDRDGCVVLAHADRSGEDTGGATLPLAISLPRTAQALPADCLYADIIVTDLIVPPDCRASVILQGDMRQKKGAVSIWLSREIQTNETPPPGRGAAQASPDDGKLPGRTGKTGNQQGHIRTSRSAAALASAGYRYKDKLAAAARYVRPVALNEPSDQYWRNRATRRPCTRTRPGPKIRVS
ncbi:ComEC/Rec2 family competence protein [Roseibium salinum]|nr:ComEC/Rec2 family competence protein [Roseibium salinum]